MVAGGCTFSSSSGGVGKCIDLLSSITSIDGLWCSLNDFTVDPLVGQFYRACHSSPHRTIKYKILYEILTSHE